MFGDKNMIALYSILALLVLIIGIVRGIKSIKNKRDVFHIGALTVLVSVIGVASSLICVVLGIYSIAIFDERYDTSASIARITILCGSIMFYCFIASCLGNITLLLQHKYTEPAG